MAFALFTVQTSFVVDPSLNLFVVAGPRGALASECASRVVARDTKAIRLYLTIEAVRGDVARRCQNEEKRLLCVDRLCGQTAARPFEPHGRTRQTHTTNLHQFQPTRRLQRVDILSHRLPRESGANGSHIQPDLQSRRVNRNACMI